MTGIQAEALQAVVADDLCAAPASLDPGFSGGQELPDAPNARSTQESMRILPAQEKLFRPLASAR